MMAYTEFKPNPFFYIIFFLFLPPKIWSVLYEIRDYRMQRIHKGNRYLAQQHQKLFDLYLQIVKGNGAPYS
jgi:hypothetical protein